MREGGEGSQGRQRQRGAAWRAGLAAAVCGCLLAACTVPPAADGAASGGATGGISSASPGSGLRPLPRQLAVPFGAPPRSAVASINYDLFDSSEDDRMPDDRVPGDEGSREVFQRGGASWYGIQFHQRRTANGERFDMTAFTAAHRTLAFGTVVCVRSLVNGREVLVRINDRGPFGPGRIIDLSRAAADSLGMLSLGIKQVTLTVIDSKGMRCSGVPADVAALAPSANDAPEEVAPMRTRTKAQPVRRAVPARQRR